MGRRRWWAVAACSAAVVVAFARAAQADRGAANVEVRQFIDLVPDGWSKRRRLSGSGRKEFEYVLQAFGEEHSVRLQVDETLFAPGYQHLVVNEESNLVPDAALESNCLCTGKNSVVSFCNGYVYGSIPHANGVDTLIIEPAPHLGPTIHRVLRSRDLEEEDQDDGNVTSASCGLPDTDEEMKAFMRQDTKIRSESDQSWKRRQLADEQVKYVEVLFLNDKAVFDREGAMTHARTAFVAGMVNQHFGTFPGSTSIQIRLTGMVTFQNGDPWEKLSADEGKGVFVDNLLVSVSEWIEANRDELPIHDISHLLSGLDFVALRNGQTLYVGGIAYLEGWCSDSIGTGLSTSTSLALDAVTAAHEIGHGLGLRHVDAETPSQQTCLGDNSFIMNAFVSSDATAWSSCSEEWLETSLQQGLGDCSNLDAAAVWPSVAICGNGLREEGEECDCVNNDCSGVDPCCDGATCRFVAGAACSANDACCLPETCQIRSSEENFVCRAGLSIDCDFDEVCDGVSALCPEDTKKPTGEVCGTNGEGACLFGTCNSRDEMCIQAGYEQSCSDGCDFLRCENSDGDCLLTASSPQGVPCDDGVCYEGICEEDPVNPLESTLLASCRNGVLDGSETAVDCGGIDCLPCYENSACNLDRDCAFPAYCGSNRTCIASVGTGIFVTQHPIVQFLAMVLDWMIENPISSACFGGAIVILFVLCCCICRNRRETKRKQKAKQKKQGQMTVNSGRDLNHLMEPVGTEPTSTIVKEPLDTVSAKQATPESGPEEKTPRKKSSVTKKNSAASRLNPQKTSSSEDLAGALVRKIEQSADFGSDHGSIDDEEEESERESALSRRVVSRRSMQNVLDFESDDSNDSEPDDQLDSIMVLVRNEREKKAREKSKQKKRKSFVDDGSDSGYFDDDISSSPKPSSRTIVDTFPSGKATKSIFNRGLDDFLPTLELSDEEIEALDLEAGETTQSPKGRKRESSDLRKRLSWFVPTSLAVAGNLPLPKLQKTGLLASLSEDKNTEKHADVLVEKAEEAGRTQSGRKSSKKSRKSKRRSSPPGKLDAFLQTFDSVESDSAVSKKSEKEKKKKEEQEKDQEEVLDDDTVSSLGDLYNEEESSKAARKGSVKSRLAKKYRNGGQRQNLEHLYDPNSRDST